MKIYGFICILLLVYCRIFSNTTTVVVQETKPAKSIQQNSGDLSIARKTTETNETQLSLMANLPVTISFTFLDLASTVR